MASPEPWDLVADAYAVEQAPAAEQIAEVALDLAELQPSAEIVDVATGPGTLALVAARRGAAVSALDFSPVMIENLRRRADEAGLDIVDVRVGDGQALPWEDERFDGAFSLVGLIFFPDRMAGFTELRRVLRPGGRAVVSSTAELPRQFITLLEAISSQLPDLPLSGGRMPLADADEFATEMSAAGFRDVRIETIEHQESWPSVADFWQRTYRSAAPLAMLHRRLEEQAWAALSDEITGRLLDENGKGPVIARYQVNLGVGSR